MPLHSVPFLLNVTATTKIYTLSLHDALPISRGAERAQRVARHGQRDRPCRRADRRDAARLRRSEEHTSELQSHSDLVCRLLLEKKNIAIYTCVTLLKSGKTVLRIITLLTKAL